MTNVVNLEETTHRTYGAEMDVITFTALFFACGVMIWAYEKLQFPDAVMALVFFGIATGLFFGQLAVLSAVAYIRSRR